MTEIPSESLRPTAAETGSPLMSQLEFEGWLHQRIEDGAPAAVVRFADAEAKMLMIERDDAESMQVALSKLHKETGLRFAAQAVFDLKEHLEFAFDRADLLGIRFDEERSLNEHRVWMKKLVELYLERSAAGRPKAALVPCLLDWSKLPAALAGRRISVISSRDVKGVLEDDWQTDDVNVYQVPSQYQVRDVDAPYEAAMHGVPIWPDAHARICSELSVRQRGEVFLVGAGLFGKDLCIRVRDQGGIALDMGSALDEIAGKLTRGPKRRVLDVYATGMPKADLFGHFQRMFGHLASRELIATTVRDTVDAETIDNMTAWRVAPLNAVYPIVHLECFPIPILKEDSAVMRKARLAWAVDCEGIRVPLGIWAGEARNGLAIDDLRRRGVRDVAIACVDPDLREELGLPSRGTQLQTCVPHLVRLAADQVDARDRKQVARELRLIYAADDLDGAAAALDRLEGAWGDRYPSIAELWRTGWEQLGPFLALPRELREATVGANALRDVRNPIERALDNHGAFADEDEAIRLPALIVARAAHRLGSEQAWPPARPAFEHHFGKRCR